MPIKTLFLDIGGVFLTNGWDRNSRKLACETFHLNSEKVEDLHHLTFDPFERGKLSLDDYLTRVVFTEKRSFTMDDFKRFMFDQSKLFPEMLELFRNLKKKHALKIFVVSNEGKELNDYRIKTFHLTDFVDAFVSSCYVHLLKPDRDIFKLALDLSQTPPEEVLYVENTFLYIEIAKQMGIQTLYHTSYASTARAIEKYFKS